MQAALREGAMCLYFGEYRPLIYAFFGNNNSYPTLEVSQLALISEYATDLRHVRGHDNQAADALCRIAALSVSPPCYPSGNRYNTIAR